MGLITTFLGVVLFALVFQKNPLLGIFVIGAFVYFKYRRSKLVFNKIKAKNGSNNTIILKEAIKEGLAEISNEIKKIQNTTEKTGVDTMESSEFEQLPINSEVYKN